ncbi:MAG: hypothetical protein KBD29_01280 [Candidatus Magasanikbacteria bacterium]|nr:hypothetical protein [Candidatus Magasanikbacteria bacterium]
MAHGHSSKKKKKKGTKFPLLGMVAWWIAFSTFAFNAAVGIVVVVALGFIPGMAEVLMYPFQKFFELEDEKEDAKKKHTHSSHH